MVGDIIAESVGDIIPEWVGDIPRNQHQSANGGQMTSGDLASIRSRAIVAGSGVIGGVGISTGLFSTIGISKILASPTGYSTAYPLVVFCLAALFLLTAAAFTVQVTPERRILVFVGMGCFALLALCGTASIYFQSFNKIPIVVTESFDPAEVTGNGMNAPRLQLTYRSANSGSPDFLPYKNPSLSLSNGDFVLFRMEGLQDLLNEYKISSAKASDEFHLLRRMCKIDKKSSVCAELSEFLTDVR